MQNLCFPSYIQCNKVFRAKSYLLSHLKMVHERSSETDIKCSSCSYSAPTKAVLRKHNESVHLKIKHSCGLCDQQYSCQSSLKLHQKAVHGCIKIECPWCDFITNRKDSVLFETNVK